MFCPLKSAVKKVVTCYSDVSSSNFIVPKLKLNHFHIEDNVKDIRYLSPS
jgi:hypothetical protein